METNVSEELEKLEQKVEERKAVVKDTEVSMKSGPSIRKGEDPLTSRPYSYTRAIQALLHGFDWSNAKVEREVHEYLSQYIPPAHGAILVPYSVRDLSEGTDSAGGYLVSPTQAAEIIDIVDAKMIFSPGGQLSKVGAAAPQLVPLPKSGQLDFPKETADFTGYWIGENATITKSDFTLDQVSLRPYKLAARTLLSNELLQDATPPVEAYIRRRFGTILAKVEERGILYGSGANRPTGLFDSTEVTKNPPGADLGENGDAPTLDNILAMMQAFESANGSISDAVFIMAPRTKYQLLKIKDTEGRYLLEPDFISPNVPRFKGVPIISSTFVPVDQTKGESDDCSFILLGDFSKLLFGRHLALEISVDKVLATYQTEIVAVERVGWAIANGDQFIIMDGVRDV